MSDYSIIAGDNRQTIPAWVATNPQTVQCVITSPPYFGHRDYGTGTWSGGDSGCNHNPRKDHARAVKSSGLTGGQASNGHAQEGFAKRCPRCGAVKDDKQAGQEETPAAFIANLVNTFGAIKPALKPTATVWVNLGDSYAGSGGAGGDYNAGGLRDGQPKAGKVKGDRPAKNLLMIPARFAIAMQDAGWILRSEIVWYKRNGMPQSSHDRCSVNHEMIYMFSMNKKYYFDHEAIAEDANYDGRKDTVMKPTPKYRESDNGQPFHRNKRERWIKNDAGVYIRRPRTVWDIPTRGLKVAHYATMPLDLAARMMSAGTAPGDLALDPFNGAATTGVAAKQAGRRYVGFELNPDYVRLSLDRLAATQPPMLVVSAGGVAIAPALTAPVQAGLF